MSPALLTASLKDSYKSMIICFGALFLYGVIIMLVFPSMKDTFSDPMAEGNGIVLTEIGKDEAGYRMFNLSWETRIGAGAHVAVGVSSPFTYTALKGFLEDNDTGEEVFTEDMFEEAVENQSVLDEYGARILYHGTGKWIEFSRTGNSSYFFVVFLVGGGNSTPVNVSDAVSSIELVQTTVFDDYLKDNAFMEGFLGNADLDFTTIEGFVSIEFMSMWPLFIAIFLGVKGGGVVSRHVEDLSMDMLLATGYTRKRFLSEKLALLGMNVIVVLLGGYVGLAAGGLLIGESLSFPGSVLMFVASIPLALAFVGIGVLLSVLADEGSKCTWRMMGIVMGMYMIQIVTNIGDGLWADVLARISLLTYMDAPDLLVNHHVAAVDIFVPLLVGIAAIGLAYYLWERKEIHA